MSTIKFVKSPLVPLTLIAASSVAWFALHDGASPTTSAPPAEGVFFIETIDETTAHTVDAWVEEADVVVEAQVASENMVEPPVSETSVGMSLDLIGRVVTLKVADTVWRSPGVTQPSPTTFAVDAFGWMREDDNSQREVASVGAARLEQGHTYVLALKWREAECAPGDETVRAHWSVVGSGAVLPADGGTIGVGEYEGSQVDLTEDPSAPEAPISSQTVLGQFIGESSAAVEAALIDAAEPMDGVSAEDTGGTCSG